MKNIKRITIAASAITLSTLLAACSTTPAMNPGLEAARTDYRNAQSNSQVASLAAGELKQASDSLERANAASNRGDSVAIVDHLAYVAKQQVAIAQATANQKAAELAVTNSAAERDKVRLEARTKEADSATRSAEAAKLNAETSQRSAETAQRDATAAQQQAMLEKQAATNALQSADVARQQAQDAENRARQLEAMLLDLQAKKTPRGLVITLGDVLFDTNQATLKAGGMRNVQKLAEFFKQNPSRKVMIEGFTDSVGSDASNQTLSEARAASVRNALMDMGVGVDRIESRGYGENNPVASNDNAAGRQLNRRVEIVLSDDNGNIIPR
jgi:outer membrane protein OmpA-like peptidoglycan-associated protein